MSSDHASLCVAVSVSLHLIQITFRLVLIIFALALCRPIFLFLPEWIKTGFDGEIPG